MRYSFMCVKCDSSEVAKIPGGDLWTKGYFNTIKVTSMKQVLVTRYVCLSCGYSEEWVEKSKDLELIKKHYKKEDGEDSFFV